MAVTTSKVSADELEAFFKSVKLPKAVDLEAGVRITNVPKFIESHLAVIRHAGEKAVFESFWARLLKLRDIIADKH